VVLKLIEHNPPEPGILDGIAEAVVGFVDDLLDRIKSIFRAIFQELVSKLADLRDAIDRQLAELCAVVGNQFEKLETFLGSFVQTILESFRELRDSFVNALQKLALNVKEAVSETFERTLRTVQSWIDKIIDKLQEAIAAVQAAIDMIGTWLADVGERLIETLRSIVFIPEDVLEAGFEQYLRVMQRIGRKLAEQQ